MINEQIEIVKSIARSIPEPWDGISINVEIDDVKGSETLSEDGDYCFEGKTEQLFLSVESERLFREMRKKMAENDSENRFWTVCNLKITSDGNYKFEFSYGKTDRINKLKNY